MIEIPRPFEAYLLEDERSTAEHGRELVLILPFETERIGTMGFKRDLWDHAQDQEAEDGKRGFDGLTARRVRVIGAMRELLGKELAETGGASTRSGVGRS